MTGIKLAFGKKKKNNASLKRKITLETGFQLELKSGRAFMRFINTGTLIGSSNRKMIF